MKGDFLFGEEARMQLPAFELMRLEVCEDLGKEPLMWRMLKQIHMGLSAPQLLLARHLARCLTCDDFSASELEATFANQLKQNPATLASINADLNAIYQRDPACKRIWHGFAFMKGFKVVLASRLAASYWECGQLQFALQLQSWVSQIFAVDIHPAAKLGPGLVIDHAHGVVIGETSVVGQDVTILQGVTLGGTGKQTGDRHPKIGNRVNIGAGATVLGNIRVGDGVIIGAGSVVLKDVDPFCTVAGVPARVVRTLNRASLSVTCPSRSESTHPPLVAAALANTNESVLQVEL